MSPYINDIIKRCCDFWEQRTGLSSEKAQQEISWQYWLPGGACGVCHASSGKIKLDPNEFSPFVLFHELAHRWQVLCGMLVLKRAIRFKEPEIVGPCGVTQVTDYTVPIIRETEFIEKLYWCGDPLPDDLPYRLRPQEIHANRYAVQWEDQCFKLCNTSSPNKS